MTQPDTADQVDAVVRRILAEPLDRRLEAFAAEMRDVLDDLAARFPRSAPRDLTRMAKKIGRLVLYRLQVEALPRGSEGRS
jgi:hypothetical protein